ncbi:hypothetical protein JHD46_00850 [Sulfurimonas sp. SAG-AH-194-C20]|nr:hypothetical protein [Sulfurimonas sp. SAG-AH-194-C20]MDF1878180.1 hypothetical protein [Sulfurimonas sp. SAG-AH-194-C20]
MVKKLLKLFAYILFFIFALIVFVPKSSVYYLLEKNLKKFDVVVSKESLSESLFSLEADNLEVSVKGIEGGVVETANITFLLFYNNVSFRNIKLSSLVEAHLPSEIDRIDVTYTLFHPLVLVLHAKGQFGEINGEFNILKRDLNVTLRPTNTMLKKYKLSMKIFQKYKDGAYIYAKSF